MSAKRLIFSYMLAGVLALTTGCTGAKDKIQYRTLGQDRVEMLNQEVVEVQATTVEDIASLYRPKDIYAEGNYSYEVSVKDVKSNVFEVTIKQEGLMDDSIYGEIAVLLVERDAEGKWKVNEIKEAYKCWPNRGHQEWGPEFCN